jgi:hypothetical protein
MFRRVAARGIAAFMCLSRRFFSSGETNAFADVNASAAAVVIAAMHAKSSLSCGAFNSHKTAGDEP